MRNSVFISIATLTLAWLCATPVVAQRIQIPNGTLVPQTAPSTTGGALGAPSFDPYATAPPPPTTNSTFPSLFGQQPTYPTAPAAPTNSYGVNPFGTSSPYNPYGAAPASTTPPFNGPSGNPFVQQPTTAPMPYGNPYAPSPYGQPFQPPNPQYPGGQWTNSTTPHQSGQPLKLFQNVRLRQTWLSRMDELDGLGINDSEIATTVAFPSFFGSTQPLYISPGFILSLWDGPGGVAADLPPRAYSGYVDFDFATNPQHQLGGEIDVRLGVYSDFATINSYSFRVSGSGLGTFRMSPAVQLKFGVEYINRNDIKLLPAGGILWTPNPQVRFDIYFPRPKLAMYVTTIGNTEIWGYVAGEYGGGAWTIERADERGSDRIDINDIRVSLGADFARNSSFRAFFEGGYVFNREIVYVASPQDDFSPGNTFMLRGGIAY